VAPLHDRRNSECTMQHGKKLLEPSQWVWFAAGEGRNSEVALQAHRPATAVIGEVPCCYHSDTSPLPLSSPPILRRSFAHHPPHRAATV
jgi:hypothetical protein